VDVKADMRIVDKGSLLAAGDVTIDGLFTIHGVKVVSFTKENGEAKSSVLLPRRKLGESDWRDVLEVTKEVKKEIDLAVSESLYKIAQTDIHKPKVDVSVNVYQKEDLLGYATVTYENAITIKNIRIYKTKDGAGIRLAFPSNHENGEWHSLVEISGFLFDGVVRSKVQEAYEEKIHAKQPEERRAAI